MKIVAFVPIKLNSTRLPQKNIKRFTNGKPLCFYILRTLLNVEGIDEVYVYCSSEEILKYIPDGVKFMKRSEMLDQDTTTFNEVLKAFQEDVYADIYIAGLATAPFISEHSIGQGLRKVINEGYDSAFTVKKLQTFYWVNKEKPNYNLEHIPRTQDLEPIYEETSGFYVFEHNVISEMNRRTGRQSFMIEVGDIEGIDIDEEEDFIVADALYNFLGERIWQKNEL